MGHHGLLAGMKTGFAREILSGFGYAKEFHVERYLREILIPRIAPVSPQLALSFIAEIESINSSLRPYFARSRVCQFVATEVCRRQM
jgi:hypothetical protein